MTQAIEIKNSLGYYLIVQDPLTFQEAVDFSNNSLGGNLVEFETQKESDKLWESISSDLVIDAINTSWDLSFSDDGGQVPYLWIGGADQDTISSRSSDSWNWQWLASGEDIGKDRKEWGDGFLSSEPDDFLGAQNRLALALKDWPNDNPGAFGYAGQWNDLSSENNLWFIVEMPRIFTINAQKKYVLEGDILKVNVITSGVFEGAILYWQIGGAGVDSNDFLAADLTGSGVVNDEGRFDISLPLATNFDEFLETIEVALYADSDRKILLDFDKILVQDSLFPLLDGDLVTISNEDFIKLLFNNVVGADPDFETLSFWLDKLENEYENREELVNIFENSNEYRLYKLTDLRTEDIRIGSGISAKEDQTVLVEYTGKLINGQQFDSGSFEFTLGTNQVIDGWEQGINGMKVGGKRYLAIPPSLAYGDREMISIPANSTLIFETELLEITNYKFDGFFKDYKFYQKDDNRYEIMTLKGFDEITGITNLEFLDITINLETDIKGTFDQITGMNDSTGQIFRLYNAALARFPDSQGLEYWINNYSSGVDNIRAVATSFIVSEEFKSAYGNDVTNEEYVQLLYNNVLNRDLDQDGFDYWVSNLNNGVETRYEVLIGFSESFENKQLFSEMTGFY